MKAKKTSVCVMAVLMMAIFSGSAHALDVGLEVQRDVLFRTTFDSIAVPTTALASVGFHLGGSFWLRVRAGYSSYYDWFKPIDALSAERRSDGIRVQLVPVAVVPTPLEQVSLLAGAVVGGRWQSDRSKSWDWWWYNYVGVPCREQSIWAIDQTFVLGLQFALSRRFALEVSAEREGFCFYHLLSSEYRVWRGEPWLRDQNEYYRITWVDAARTGLGIGLRVKL